jgi:DNA-binding transcriptional MocR family regulator
MTKVMGATSNETIPHRKLPILLGILTTPRIISHPVAIESPTFFGLLQIIESPGLHPLEIPTSPTARISLEALEISMLAYGNIKAVVVVPHLQNPRGGVAPNERKAGLLQLCARNQVAVEDESYRELPDDAVQIRPLKAWDRDGGVIHCASLNKSPGAWIEAGVDVVGAMARTGQDD